MANSTVPTVPSAIPDFQDMLALLGPQLQELWCQRQAFRQQPPTPEQTCAFEKKTAEILRTLGRELLENEYNRLEPEQLQDCPLRLRLAGQAYRRRPKSPNKIGTLFGEITLKRYLYQAVEPGERALFPLERHLGIEAGLATPALAERTGLWSAEHEQEQVRRLLRQEHDVHWSVTSLRKVAAALRDGLASFREPTQVAKVLELLDKADRSKGKHRPVLAAGRDGIHVPIRAEGYHEGATATLSVLDRQGRRLGTVYLGQMPESGQGTLSAQLTALLTKVLSAWHGQGRRAPRLAYVTDAGNHPKEYYLQALRHLADPWRPGQKLAWQWIVDFWHGCGYVHDLAEALFGDGARAWGRFRKWRQWLRDRHQGVANVLRAAMWYYNNGGPLSTTKEEAFWKAYRYLRKYAVWMKYAHYKSQGLPIGSGVTEAACKTVFAERLKRSGMTWKVAGGQVIVDLRVLVLSRVWQAAHQAYLASRNTVRIRASHSHLVLCVCSKPRSQGGCDYDAARMLDVFDR
jgi:hypothetical protein